MNDKANRERSRGFGGAAAAWSPADLDDIVDYGIGTGLVQDDPAPGEGINNWPGELGVIIPPQTTGAAKPAFGAGGSPNGNDVATFDGGDWLGSDVSGGSFPATIAQPYSVFGLFKATTSQSQIVWAWYSTVHMHWAVSPDAWRMTSGTLWTINPRNESINNWYRYIVTVNGASSDLEIDEVSYGGGDMGSTGLAGFRLGQWNSSLFFKGSQAVWGLASDAFTAGEKAELWPWLAAQ